MEEGDEGDEEEEEEEIGKAGPMEAGKPVVVVPEVVLIESDEEEEKEEQYEERGGRQCLLCLPSILRPTSLTASLTELDLELCEVTRTPGPNLSREFILFFCQCHTNYKKYRKRRRRRKKKKKWRGDLTETINGVASEPFRYSLIFSSKTIFPLFS